MNGSSPADGILLLGMKHSGKTTLGRRLAGGLGLDFADLDEIMEGLYDSAKGTTCREIYRRHGKDFFTELESRAAAALAEMMARAPMVAALGGGTIENTNAMAALMESGIKVYLREEPSVLYERIMQHGLPAFLNPDDPRASFEELYARRTKLYEERADLVVDLDGSGVEEAFARLEKRLEARGTLPRRKRG